jgi:hypothetical protein
MGSDGQVLEESCFALPVVERFTTWLSGSIALRVYSSTEPYKMKIVLDYELNPRKCNFEYKIELLGVNN